MKLMKKLLLIGLIVLFLFVGRSAFAWTKDKGVSCDRVFASITNENDTLDYSGHVTANATQEATVSGTAQPHDVVTVEWTPPAGFSGHVETYVELRDGEQKQDSTFVEGDLDCPAPTETLVATPSASLTPGPSATGVPPTGVSKVEERKVEVSPAPTLIPCSQGGCGWK